MAKDQKQREEQRRQNVRAKQKAEQFDRLQQRMRDQQVGRKKAK